MNGIILFFPDSPPKNVVSNKISYLDSQLFSTLKIPSVHKCEKYTFNDVCKQIYSE